ncbi:MAG: hypothetical protein AB2L20_12245 [Mangrovibacterium sp.]
MVFSKLGRLDRAIAENLPDIRSSFDECSGIVLDFIVFISQRIKTDLFGYTRFTLKDFCQATGRNRQDLAIRHPLFQDSKKRAPEIDGFRFETVFDYALISMMQRNLIFTEVYESKESDKVIRLESIRIISDVRLNFSRRSNEVKVYDVRISPEILEGFIRRYYTIDVNAYKLAGKGRGKEGRQSLVIYLSVLRHLLFSQGLHKTTVPMDILAKQANINLRKESFHLKEAITHLMSYLKEKAGLNFDFRFVRNNASYPYYVELFFPDISSARLLAREHNFYFSLLNDLKSFFNYKYGHSPAGANGKKEPFQAWLTSPADAENKVRILKSTYSRIFQIDISDTEAYGILRTGFPPKE